MENALRAVYGDDAIEGTRLTTSVGDYANSYRLVVNFNDQFDRVLSAHTAETGGKRRREIGSAVIADAAENEEDTLVTVETLREMAFTQCVGEEEDDDEVEKVEKPIRQSPPSHDDARRKIALCWKSDETIVVQRSKFQGHVLRVQSPAEFDPLIAMQALFLAKPNLLKATHNFYAFVTTTARDNSDDGESGAGRKLAELLSLRRDTNVMVVVSRWFGGVKMGPGRFKVFAHVASTALEKF